MRSQLRLAPHRSTTAHVSSIYPFSVQASFGYRGPYIGLDVLAGSAEFCWDPFEAYASGAVTNPNGWVLGEPGNGKSALVKCLLWRMAAIYGHGPGGRWMAIIDPKGEYRHMAQRLGLTVLRLAPGGDVRINPLAPGPATGHETRERQTLRRADLLCALVATIEHLTASSLPEPTLGDVATVIADPPAALVDRLHRSGDDLARDLAPVVYALDKLLVRSLRGIFDGLSTVPLRWDGPGLVLDLSAIPLDSDALPLVMVAAAGWLQQLMACPGPQRIQVLDEAWALLANRHTAHYLQSCFKLGRTYGVASLCVAHRASDLSAQADDGTATAKIAAGLLADSATKIILRQAPDQVDAATGHFGLTGPEADIIGQLARGRALWKVGGRTAVVQHVLAPSEVDLVDTDARMAGVPSGFGASDDVAAPAGEPSGSEAA